jgi:DNA polymerase-1
MGYLMERGYADFADNLAAHLVGTNAPVAFDTETTGLNPRDVQILACSFAGVDPEGGPWAATLFITDLEGEDDCVALPDWLLDWIESEDHPKVLANAKYDMSVIKEQWGVQLSGVVGDVMLMSQMLDDTEQYHNLDALAFRHLGLTKLKTTQLIGSGKDEVSMADVPHPYLALYANEDVAATYAVWLKLDERIHHDGLGALLDLEMQVLPAVTQMELNGVRIDSEALGRMTVEFGGRAENALAKAREIALPARAALAADKRARYEKFDSIWKRAKEADKEKNGGSGKAPEAISAERLRARTAVRSAEAELNLGSPPQLQELLYNKWELHRNLGMRHPPKTKKGNPSTANDVLEKLAPYSPFVAELLKYRQVAKLVSTYTDKLPDMVDPKTGRVHGSFWQCGARTGRFTSSDPNLQNIPNRSEEGRRIRTAFIPEEGMVLVAADYSQIEPRVAAHMSGEQVWIEAYQLEQDLYKATAAAIHKYQTGEAIAVDDVDSVMRHRAKTVVLASLYGAGPQKIAGEAKIPFDDAVSLIDAFWASVPDLRAFMDGNIAYAREHKEIWTMDRLRRRHIPDIDHKWGGVRKGAENQAGNTPVQGTAADILKRAMTMIHPHLPDWGARMLLQVHDELVFECPIDNVLAFKDNVTEMMESAATLVVPLVAEVAIGDNWAEAH